MSDQIDGGYLDQNKVLRKSANDAWIASLLAQEPQKPIAGQPRPTSAPVTTDQSVLSEVGTGIARGFGSAVGEPIGTAIELAGKATGLDAVATFGEHVAKGWEFYAHAHPRSPDAMWNGAETLLHPRWWTATVAETVPQLAAMLIPAGEAGRFIKLGEQTFKWTPELALKLSRLGAAATGGAVGGIIQGSGTYQALREKGASETEALRGAAFMATVAAGAMGVTYGSAFLPREAVSQVAGTAGIGAVTNWLQSTIGSVTLGADVKDAMRQGIEGAVAGGVMGGIAGAVGHVAAERPAAIEQAAIPPAAEGGKPGAASSAAPNPANAEAPKMSGELHVNLDSTIGAAFPRISAAIDRTTAERMAADRATRPLESIRTEGHAIIPDVRTAATFDIRKAPGEQLPAVQRALEDHLAGVKAHIDEVMKRPLGNPADEADFAASYAVGEAIAMQVEYGKSIFGRHGRGQQEAPLYPEYSPMTWDEIRDVGQGIQEGSPVSLTMDRLRAVQKTRGKAGERTMMSNLISGVRRGESVFYEAWINGMLSSPATHAANFISNMLTAVWALPERFLAENAPGHTVVRGESLAMARGAVEGFMDALRFTGQVLRTGEGRSKLETSDVAIRAPQAIADSPMGHAINYLGNVIRSPSRTLAAGDAFFKGIAYRMELKAQALRLATAEGLSAKELAARMVEIETQPPKGIEAQARQFALIQTFQNDLGPGMQGFQRWVQNTPGMRLILPFIRTPVNLARWSISRTPALQFAMREMRTDLASAGPARDLALAKIATGGMMAAGVATLAASKMISGGGPQDKDLRDILKATGWQPYSIKVGDRWYSYNRTDPIGMTLGIIADASDMIGHLPGYQADQIGMAVTLAVARNIGSKTYVQGLSNVVDAIHDPGRRGHAFAEGLARSMVPAGLRAITRTEDRTLHETRTLLDQVRAGIPGWSSSLPPSRNILGDPILLTGGLGPDIVSPIYTSSEKHDPVLDELARVGVSLSMPPKVLFGPAPQTIQTEAPKPGEGIPLTPQQYDDFVRMAGEPLRKALAHAFAKPAYKNGTDGARQLIIRSIVSVYRDAAQAKLLHQEPSLRAALRQQKINKAQALTNRTIGASARFYPGVMTP